MILASSARGLAETEPLGSRERIALLVADSAFTHLAPLLKTYEADVEERFRVDLVIARGLWTTPEEVRRTLQELYKDDAISGAILFGRLPYGLWHFPGHQPMPVFYEDLDGEFLDIGHMKHSKPNDGVYDFWDTKRQVDPLEIWVAWMRPQQCDPDPVASLKHFLNKTHNYYIGNAIYPKRGLIHSHATFPHAANPGSEYYTVFSRIYGDDLFVEGGKLRYPYPTTDYKYRLTEGFELVSAPWCHGSGFQTGGLSVFHIQGMQPPRSLMTVSWSCSSANWHGKDSNNLGISYVMGNSLVQVSSGLAKYSDGENVGTSAYSDGQVFIGVSRPIGTEENYRVFRAMARGQYAGQAYMTWLRTLYRKGRSLHHNGTFQPWDFVFIGNPFIRLNDVRLSTATPYFVYEGYGSTSLLLFGQAFQPGARIRLTNSLLLDTDYFCDILSVCKYRIEARLPESLPLGVYHVTVSNPDGQGASLIDHFFVIAPKADSDGDGLTDHEEVEKYLTNPFDWDTDGDKLSDGQEASGLLNVHYDYRPTDPTDPDSDSDNLMDDYAEITGRAYYRKGVFTNPCDWDTDNDGLADGCEKQPLNPHEPADRVKGPRDPKIDTDRDGLSDKEENFPYKTLPGYVDSDGDGLGDGEERDYWMKRGIEPTGDIDRDKQRNIMDRDSDNDGLLDGIEFTSLHTDPAKFDTDGDGMHDGWEVYYSLSPLADDAKGDPDGDGIGNLEEYLRGTEPANPPPSPNQRNVYFVDGKNGSDAFSGRYSRCIGVDGAWKTINYAISQLTEGDICWVRAGTYEEQVDNSASDRITLLGDWRGKVWADSLTRPIIDGTNRFHNCIKCRKSNCVFENFEVRNATLRNVQFWRPGGNNRAVNMASHHAGQIGFFIEYGSTGNIIEDCVSRDNKYGVQILGLDNLRASGTVRRCTIYRNSLCGINGRNGSLGTKAKEDPPLESYPEAIIESCLIYDNEDGVVGPWATLRVVNSTIAGNKSCGVKTCYGAAAGEIRNCIITGSKTGISGGSAEFVTSYNNLWGNATNWADGASKGRDSISADPLYVNQDECDYRIRAASPCVDRGVGPAPSSDLRGTASGDPPNMGCYER